MNRGALGVAAWGPCLLAEGGNAHGGIVANGVANGAPSKTQKNERQHYCHARVPRYPPRKADPSVRALSKGVFSEEHDRVSGQSGIAVTLHLSGACPVSGPRCQTWPEFQPLPPLFAAAA